MSEQPLPAQPQDIRPVKELVTLKDMEDFTVQFMKEMIDNFIPDEWKENCLVKMTMFSGRTTNTKWVEVNCLEEGITARFTVVKNGH